MVVWLRSDLAPNSLVKVKQDLDKKALIDHTKYVISRLAVIYYNFNHAAKYGGFFKKALRLTPHIVSLITISNPPLAIVIVSKSASIFLRQGKK